eukprot:gene9335-biopygen11200
MWLMVQACMVSISGLEVGKKLSGIHEFLQEREGQPDLCLAARCQKVLCQQQQQQHLQGAQSSPHNTGSINNVSRVDAGSDQLWQRYPDRGPLVLRVNAFVDEALPF